MKLTSMGCCLLLAAVFCGAAHAGVDRELGDFGVGKHQPRLFRMAQGDPEQAEHERAVDYSRPRLMHFGISTGPKYAIDSGFWNFGLYVGARVADEFSIVIHGEVSAGFKRRLSGASYEVGPRWHFIFDRSEGAYVDLRWAVAHYNQGFWASATGIFVGVGYEGGSHTVRGFFETGVRGMVVFKSGGNDRFARRNFKPEEVDRYANFQYYILRAGVRFYFGRR
jgi:hypothetical protein